jgi:hypothetical protein
MRSKTGLKWSLLLLCGAVLGGCQNQPRRDGGLASMGAPPSNAQLSKQTTQIPPPLFPAGQTTLAGGATYPGFATGSGTAPPIQPTGFSNNPINAQRQITPANQPSNPSFPTTNSPSSLLTPSTGPVLQGNQPQNVPAQFGPSNPISPPINPGSPQGPTTSRSPFPYNEPNPMR